MTAAVAFLASASETPLHVDPRPLRADAKLHSVDPGDILSADSATTRLRTRVLFALNIPRTDATEDWRCVSAAGMRGPGPGERGGSDPIWEQIRAAEPDSVRSRREACRAREPYTSVIFGPPQGGTHPEHPQWWRIRAMRMMLNGWEIVDLFLERSADGEWKVVHMQVRVGAFS